MRRELNLGFIGISFLVSSCQVVNFQDASTLGKGNREVIIGFDNLPFELEPLYDEYSHSSFYSWVEFAPIFPRFDFSKGISNTLDHHLSISVIGGIDYGLKINILNTSCPEFAVALEPSFGIGIPSFGFPGFDNGFREELLLIGSYYPSQNLSLSLSTSFLNLTSRYNYRGYFDPHFTASFNMKFCRRVKFICGVGAISNFHYLTAQYAVGIVF